MREIQLPLPHANRPAITLQQAESHLAAVLKIYKRDVDRADRVLTQAKGIPPAKSSQESAVLRGVRRMVRIGASSASKQVGLQDFESNSNLLESLRRAGYTTKNQQFLL